MLLLDFPSGFVDGTDVFGDGLNGLDGPFVTQNIVFHGESPHVQSNEVLDQVLVEHHELARKGSTNVEVGGERFKAFVVPEDLGGRSRWHGSQQQRVAHAVFHDVSFQSRPVPTAAVIVLAPQIELKQTLAGR